MNNDAVSKEVAEAMGVSNASYDEVTAILGHLPSEEDLSTLLAMWDSNGRQQGLFTWLCGQPHATQLNDYLYNGERSEANQIREPHIRECYDIATELFAHGKSEPIVGAEPFVATGESLFLVGNISSQFLDSTYARNYLHLASNPMDMGSNESNREYHLMILEALTDAGILHSQTEVSQGGLFSTLLHSSIPNGYGFDILCAREIRLDAFLFGEEPGRFIVSLSESDDDFFLLKMDEARINCCFLGRTTSNRILIDGYDFGSIKSFAH